VQRFRDEENRRDQEEARAQERRHKEVMEEQRKMRDALERRNSGPPGAAGGGSSSWENGADDPGKGSGDWAAEMDKRLSSMQSQLNADSGKGSSDSSGKKKGEAVGVLDRVRQLVRRTKSPLQRALFLLSRYQMMPYWSMPTDYDERMAPDVMATTYNSGTAAQGSTQWARDHGMEKSKMAVIHRAICEVMDAATLDDDVPQLVNCEFFERLCRWKYGLERVHEDVRTQDDWKGAKPQIKWGLLEEYSPSHRGSTDPRSKVGDQQVQENLQGKALFNKWLSKGGAGVAGTDGGG